MTEAADAPRVCAAPAPSDPIKIFVVAGEKSGDDLGGKLMQALRRAGGGEIHFAGVGGPAMEAQGLASLFPLADIAVMGFVPVLRRLPTILQRIRETSQAALAWRPDLVIIIDSPDFTHRVARRLRRESPKLPIVDYVSPTVWAWRPGRARAMRKYVDHLFALLPFEPEAHRRLQGPPTSYVGHPLTERLDELRPNAQESQRRESAPPLVLLLPGSRRLEIERLLDDFGAAAEQVSKSFGPIDWALPCVDHLAPLIEQKVATWRTPVRILRGEAAKYQAFRNARAALAASGTVTLELALAGVPMIVAYKVSPPETLLKYVVTASSIVLPNLILGERAIPELLQKDCTPQTLADRLMGLLRDGPERAAQSAALAKLDDLMKPPGGVAPSEAAARIALDLLRAR